MTHAAPPSTLQAPAYGLLLGHTECHFCHAPTPTAAIWVPSFEEHDDEGLVDQGEGAVLRYIERLDEDTVAFVAGHAPWLRFATTLERQGKPTWPITAPPVGPFKGTTSCSRRMVLTGPRATSSLHA